MSSNGDELNDEERAELDRELEAAIQEADDGQTVDFTEALAGLRRSLTDDEETGLIQAIASLEAGNGRTLEEVRSKVPSRSMSRLNRARRVAQPGRGARHARPRSGSPARSRATLANPNSRMRRQLSRVNHAVCGVTRTSGRPSSG